jgi:hypothetical protein
MKRSILILPVAISLIFMFSAICAADGGIQKCGEQTLIVGASYLELNTFDGPDQFVWSSFTVRNVDPQHEITVVKVDFYDPEGNLVAVDFLPDGPVAIDSYESKTWRASRATLYYPPSGIGISEYDSEDGRPFFLVKWVADKKVIKPMIGSVAVLTEPNIPVIIDYKALSNLNVKVVDQKCNNPEK